MNPHNIAASRMIKLHGVKSTYTKITSSYDLDTRQNTLTETNSTVTMYRKQISNIAYQFPSFIGKEAADFYILASDIASPQLEDKITFDSETYVVKRVEKKSARGEVVIYILTGIK